MHWPSTDRRRQPWETSHWGSGWDCHHGWREDGWHHPMVATTSTTCRTRILQQTARRDLPNPSSGGTPSVDTHAGPAWSGNRPTTRFWNHRCPEPRPWMVATCRPTVRIPCLWWSLSSTQPPLHLGQVEKWQSRQRVASHGDRTPGRARQGPHVRTLLRAQLVADARDQHRGPLLADHPGRQQHFQFLLQCQADWQDQTLRGFPSQWAQFNRGGTWHSPPPRCEDTGRAWPHAVYDTREHTVMGTGLAGSLQTISCTHTSQVLLRHFDATGSSDPAAPCIGIRIHRVRMGIQPSGRWVDVPGTQVVTPTSLPLRWWFHRHRTRALRAQWVSSIHQVDEGARITHERIQGIRTRCFPESTGHQLVHRARGHHSIPTSHQEQETPLPDGHSIAGQ